MITAQGQRAARALLGWGVRELAAAAGVSFNTISQFENGRPLRASTAAKILAAFEAEGVELVADDDKTGALLVFARRTAGGAT